MVAFSVRKVRAAAGVFYGSVSGNEWNSTSNFQPFAVREQVVRSSADIPEELRKVLDSVEVGKLTAPEVTKVGVEMFAMCAKKESGADNTPGKRKVRETIQQQRYEERSKAYLQEIRRGAMIEYK